MQSGGRRVVALRSGRSPDGDRDGSRDHHQRRLPSSFPVIAAIIAATSAQIVGPPACQICHESPNNWSGPAPWTTPCTVYESEGLANTDHTTKAPTCEARK